MKSVSQVILALSACVLSILTFDVSAHAQSIIVYLNGDKVIDQALVGEPQYNPSNGAYTGTLFSGEQDVQDQNLNGLLLTHTVKWKFVFNEDALAPAGSTPTSPVLKQYQSNKMLEIATDQNSDAPRHFKAQVVLPTSHQYSNVNVGLIGAMVLTTNEGGGALSCSEEDNAQQNPLFAAIIDPVSATQYEIAGQPLYWCSFVMSSSGAATMQTNINFGIPFSMNAIPSPAIQSAVGVHFSGAITSGDKAGLIVMLLMSGATACLGDLTVDGIVDSTDLSVVLENWGSQASPLVGDANLDGVVNSADIGVVLGNFGSCPQ